VLNSYKYAIKGFAAKLSDRQLKALKNDPRIRSVTPNALFKLAYRTNTTGSFIFSKIDVVKSSLLFNSQILPWGVARVGGPLNGTGKIAWILDSGIDLDHPDLNVDVNNSASFIASESADDQDGHGTHVAGIIAAKNNSIGVVGVAAGATVVAVKVCNSLPPSDPNSGCPVSSIINGVDYTAIRAQPGDIVNMSLGGYDPNNNYTSIDDAVINAANAGIRFSIAAGNDASNASSFTPARVNHSNVWTVSAFRQGDEFVQTFDSNTPNCNPLNNPNSGSNYGNPPVDFSGPGESIFSLWKNGGTNTTCGTSMADPHIAGLLLTVPNDISIDGYVTNDPDNNPDKIAAYVPVVLSAPYIFASVVNGYPKISWGAVTNAQNYKVYRRIEDGSWSLYTTTSSTSLTDYSQYSSNMSVIFNPHPVWTGKLSYQIKAAASGINDSPYSNTVYFSKTGTGGPIE